MTLINGRFVKNAVAQPKIVAATTAALPAVTYANGTAGVGATLTANANGAFPAQDGVSVTQGQVVLVKNQAAGLQNGVYTLTDAGSGGTPFILTRHGYADEALELVQGHLVYVTTGGTSNGGHLFALTADVTTVGTTAVVYANTDTSNLTEGTELFTLSGTDITNGFVTLAHAPSVPSQTHLFVVGGENQVYGSGNDFTVSGAVLTWTANLAPDLSAGMQLVVNYWY